MDGMSDEDLDRFRKAVRDLFGAAGLPVPDEVENQLDSQTIREGALFDQCLRDAGTKDYPVNVLSEECDVRCIFMDENDSPDGPGALTITAAAKEAARMVADDDKMPKLDTDGRGVVFNICANTLSMGYAAGILFERRRAAGELNGDDAPRVIDESAAQELADLFAMPDFDPESDQKGGEADA